MRIVVFTGAGAGKADGLPIQTELFSRFFGALDGPRQRIASDIRGFFRDTFLVDPVGNSGAALPTFEETLGIVELSVLRDEGVQRIVEPERVRRQLILALAAAVADPVRRVDTVHGRLVRSLRESGLLTAVTFVTTNYDTLLDDAIELEGIASGRGTGSLVDYGLSTFGSATTNGHTERRTTRCYKLHGSLNWLVCPVCALLDITYGSGVTRLIDDPQAAECPACGSQRTPVIVPPSYFKDVSNVYLATVWNLAFRSVQSADRIVFCGYSLPDADMHVKFMLKRAQLNRDVANRPLSVLLVNGYAGKPESVSLDELNRYGRFFGPAHVQNSGLSFADFAENPARLLR